MKCDDTEVSKSLSLLNRWSPRNDIMSYTFSSIIDTEKWHVVQIPQMSLLLQGFILLFGLSIIVDLLWNNLLNYFRHTWSTNMYANSVQFMISIVSRFHHKTLFGIWTTNYVAALKIAAKKVEKHVARALLSLKKLSAYTAPISDGEIYETS